jgi:phenylalanyl-tRNA synthetase alpha chain
MPPQAAERLALQQGQKNVLLRFVLRHPTKSLTDADANDLRDAVYAAVHEGTECTWVARQSTTGLDISTPSRPGRRS